DRLRALEPIARLLRARGLVDGEGEVEDVGHARSTRQLERSIGAPTGAGDGGAARRGVDARTREDAVEDVAGERREAEALTAAARGLQESVGPLREQDEVDPLRGLLERLEERVRGLRVRLRE